MKSDDVKSPISYIGAKTLLGKKFLSYIPVHDLYVEVFGGSAALLFVKQKSRVEVYNDKNLGLVSLYKVFSNEELFNKFYEKIECMPYSREIFEYYINVNADGDVLETAIKYFVKYNMSYSGCGREFSVSFENCRRFENLKSYLKVIFKRFNGVIVENLDWKELLDKYIELYKNNSESFKRGLFIYLDPPYYLDSKNKNDYYEVEMSNDEHKDIVRYLLQYTKNDCKIYFMLSGYENKYYKELEDNGWYRVDFNKLQTINYNVEDRMKIDSIWMNYDIRYI
jgi:DNA adenine methylase